MRTHLRYDLKVLVLTHHFLCFDKFYINKSYNLCHPVEDSNKIPLKIEYSQLKIK